MESFVFVFVSLCIDRASTSSTSSSSTASTRTKRPLPRQPSLRDYVAPKEPWSPARKGIQPQELSPEIVDYVAFAKRAARESSPPSPSTSSSSSSSSPSAAAPSAAAPTPRVTKTKTMPMVTTRKIDAEKGSSSSSKATSFVSKKERPPNEPLDVPKTSVLLSASPAARARRRETAFTPRNKSPSKTTSQSVPKQTTGLQVDPPSSSTIASSAGKKIPGIRPDPPSESRKYSVGSKPSPPIQPVPDMTPPPPTQQQQQQSFQRPPPELDIPTPSPAYSQNTRPPPGLADPPPTPATPSYVATRLADPSFWATKEKTPPDERSDDGFESENRVFKPDTGIRRDGRGKPTQRFYPADAPRAPPSIGGRTAAQNDNDNAYRYQQQQQRQEQEPERPYELRSSIAPDPQRGGVTRPGPEPKPTTFAPDMRFWEEGYDEFPYRWGGNANFDYPGGGGNPNFPNAFMG